LISRKRYFVGYLSSNILHNTVGAINMADGSDALAACQEILPGLDPDIFEYIVGLLEDFSPSDDDPNGETMQGTIAEFLVETEYCADVTVANEKASGLLQRLGLQSSEQDRIEKSGIPQTVSVSMQQQTAALSLDAKPMPKLVSPPLPPFKDDDATATITTTSEPSENSNMKTEKATSKSTSKDSRKSKSSKKKMTDAERAVAQALEIEAELHTARIAAVQARTKQGAYKGSLDATSFTLPNPGGGIPLLEDAACTLVWGASMVSLVATARVNRPCCEPWRLVGWVMCLKMSRSITCRKKLI
jgi:hypothetical protein